MTEKINVGESQVDSMAGSALNGLFDNMVKYRREFYEKGEVTSFMDGRMIDGQHARRLKPAWAEPFGHYPEPND